MIKLIEIPCQVCNGKNFKIIKNNKKSYLNINKFELDEIFKASSSSFDYDQVVQCNDCSFVFINPRLPKNLIEKFYSLGEDLNFSTQNNERIKTFEKSLLKLQKKLSINFRDLNCLDVGSASGAFLKACKNFNINCKGIEPNFEMVNFAKNEYQVDIKQGFLDSDSFNEQFDVIFFWDVLEHVYDIPQTLKIISSYLKEGGYLIVNYPCYNSIVAKILGNKWPFWLSVHLSYFEKKTLNKIVSNYNLIYVDEFVHIQSLKLSYVFFRICKIFPILKFLNLFFQNYLFKKLSFSYYIGQKLHVSRKN